MYFYLCLKELDESGKVVLVLATVSSQITLNNLVASLAHIFLLPVRERRREKRQGRWRGCSTFTYPESVHAHISVVDYN